MLPIRTKVRPIHYFLSNEPSMAKPLRSEVANCLNARGIAPPAEITSVQALREQLTSKNDGAVDACVTESASKLYPDIPFIPLN